MGGRRQSRETALQVLYLLDITSLSVDEALIAVNQNIEAPPKVAEFSKTIIDGVVEQRTRLDELITRYAENWEIARMAAIDRNVLRIGTFEIINHPETPISVIIDEALEIVKTYSTEDSGKFVNGILDKMKSERRTKP
ncbi:MAG TPA: transcription antitermination factor NusB [Elusimicrobiota bacterium]|nr:transcription antitermination factor NusB [Elusimicrobiota bacterium]